MPDYPPLTALAGLFGAVGTVRAVRTTGRLPAHPKAPRRYADFSTVVYGARFMGADPGGQPFPSCSRASRPVTTPASVALASSADQLAYLVGQLAARKMPVYAVDLSIRELDSVGLSAVRVASPGCSPRLYDAPVQMGLRAWSERQLNPWPQPFA